MIELTIIQTLWLAGATLAVMLATALGFYRLGRLAERRIWHDITETVDNELRRRHRATAEALGRARGGKA